MKPSILITKHGDALVASAVACTFIYLFSKHSGIGVSPDSVTYFTTAENICTHFSFSNFNGLPTVDFPLGYPSLLALSIFISGLQPLQILPILNMLLYSGLLLFTSKIIADHTQGSSLYKLLILAALACSPCLLEIYSMLWSETLFLFFTLLFFIAMYQFLLSHSNQHLWMAALIAALAFFTRYAGITLIATGSFLILFDGEIALRKKIKQLVQFLLVGSSIVLINLIRNNLVTGHITGVREKALRKLAGNLNQIGIVLTDWLPFLKGHTNIATGLFLVLFVFGIGQLLFRILQQQYYKKYETILTAFFVIYATFIITIASVSRFEDLSSRLLSPLYIPMLLLATSWFIPFIQRSSLLKKRIFIFIGLFFYTSFLYNQYKLNAEAWEGIKDAGMPGYTEDSWKKSPTMDFINKNKNLFSIPVYANANDGVYFLTGIHAKALPHKEIKTEINALLQTPSFWLVWLTDGENNDLVTLDFIRQHKKIISVHTLDDGSVYNFSEKEK